MWHSPQDKRSSISPLALLLSVGVHLLLLGLLYFVHLSSVVRPPRPTMEVHLVDGIVQEEPKGEELPAERGEELAPRPKPATTPQPQPATPNPPRPTPRKQVEPKQTAPPKPAQVQQAPSSLKAEEEARQQAEQAKQEAAKSAVAGAFGKAKGKSATAVQGADAPASGKAKQGSGTGQYALEGRSIVGNGGLPARPNTKKPIRGRVVVGIMVNTSGKVIDAWIDPKGTQIADADIRQAAITAAKATRFNSISSGSDQRGKITYHFEIQ